MTRSEIIELSNGLTERKGEKVLNLNALFAFVCQDICKRQRFWWRRGQVTFTIVAGTATYDLTTITTVPASQLSEIAVEEITRLEILTSPNPLQLTRLDPVFDPAALVAMMANSTPAQPSRYTMDANDYKTLRVDIPDANYTAYMIYWAMPNPKSDTTATGVPVIPPWGHNVIVSGMNAKIFKFAYGSRNEKTLDAIAEYEQGIQDLQMRKDFDPNKRQQLITGEDAVRST